MIWQTTSEFYGTLIVHPSTGKVSRAIVTSCLMRHLGLFDQPMHPTERHNRMKAALEKTTIIVLAAHMGGYMVERIS